MKKKLRKYSGREGRSTRRRQEKGVEVMRRNNLGGEKENRRIEWRERSRKKRRTRRMMSEGERSQEETKAVR